MAPTTEEIIAMAREAAGYGDGSELSGDAIERFFALAFKAGQEAEAKRAFEEGFVTTGAMREAVLKEREACEHAATVAISLCADPVAAIRARSET